MWNIFVSIAWWILIYFSMLTSLLSTSGPIPLFYTREIFSNEISAGFFFSVILTKHKAYIINFTTILTVAGTFLSFLTLTGKQTVKKFGLGSTSREKMCVSIHINMVACWTVVFSSMFIFLLTNQPCANICVHCED